MMEAEIPLFAAGLVFGALLLCAGLTIGLWLGRRQASVYQPHSLDAFHLVNLLRGLFKWTDGFANDVSHYREVVDRAWEHFNSVKEEDVRQGRASVMDTLSQIADANKDLQNRLERAESALQEQAEEIAGYMSEARTDTLTGLPNRRVFDDELTRRIAEFRRNGSPISVMLIDIDHFKQFNDRYGHPAGDAVLERVARVLRETVRESDLVARIGGEEFAVILPGSEEPQASLAAERARRAVEAASCRYEGRQLRVSISCGVAQAAREEGVSSLVKRADEALYASKAAGRNTAYWHNGETCIPITGRVARQRPGPDAAARLQADDEFRQVCSDLRQRLVSVVEEEAAAEA